MSPAKKKSKVRKPVQLPSIELDAEQDSSENPERGSYNLPPIETVFGEAAAGLWTAKLKELAPITFVLEASSTAKANAEAAAAAAATEDEVVEGMLQLSKRARLDPNVRDRVNSYEKRLAAQRTASLTGQILSSPHGSLVTPPPTSKGFDTSDITRKDRFSTGASAGISSLEAGCPSTPPLTGKDFSSADIAVKKEPGTGPRSVVSSSHMIYSPKPPASRRHNCILNGHNFEKLKLPPPKYIFREAARSTNDRGQSERRGYYRKTENAIGGRKYKCERCHRKIDELKILRCSFELCGIMVCGGCKKPWEGKMELEGK